MTDVNPILKPLLGQLYRRLDFRMMPFGHDLASIQTKCISEGLGSSGALVKRIVRAFSDEAKTRTDIVEVEVRKYRLSCLAKSLISSKSELVFVLERLIRQHIQYCKNECEIVLLPLRQANPGRSDSIITHLKAAEDASLSSCIGLLQAVVEEIVMSAEVDLDALTSQDRPSHTYYTTVHGQIASLAQGEASVASVQQFNSGVSDLAQLLPLVRAAMADWSPENRVLAAGSEAMIQVEVLSPEPDYSLLKAASAKVGSIALRAGETIATQALLGFLRAHGWMS